MSLDAMTTFPDRFTAGDTFRYTMPEVADYALSDGWQVQIAFRAVGFAPIDLTSFRTGTGYGFDVPATITGNWAAGERNTVAKAVKSGQYKTLATGYLVIDNDPAGDSSATDSRSHVKTCLDLLEAAIEGRIPQGIDSYAVDGLDIRKASLATLFELRTKYAQMYAIEQRKALGQPVRTILFEL